MKCLVDKKPNQACFSKITQYNFKNNKLEKNIREIIQSFKKVLF